MAKSSEREIVVDFTGVKGGGGRLKVPEGDYPFKVTEVVRDTSKSSGNSMLVVHFVGLDGAVKGKKTRDYMTLTKDSLWKLRGFMEALGLETPDKKAKINIDAFVGKKVGITLNDDEYEGKISSKPTDYIPFDQIGDLPTDDDDEEEEDDDIDLDEEDDETDLSSMDRNELKAYIKEKGLDIKVKKSMDADDIRAAIGEADDEDEELEDIDLDEEM